MHLIDALPGILHLLHHYNLWRENNDDPEEGDISNFQFRQLGPGRFAMTGTMYRTVSPGNMNQGGVGSPSPGAIGGFASMLNSIIGGARAMPQNQDGQDGQGAQGQGMPTSGFGQTTGGHRFTYTAGARLHPRDPNNPGPHLEPVDELNK
jgi:E3 ubiquitin-protein ligase RNF115/126